MYHEWRLPAIRVNNRSGVRPTSMKDSLALFRAVFESDRTLGLASAVIVTSLDGAVDGGESDWDFGDLPGGPSAGGEQYRAVLSSFSDLVSQMGVVGSQTWAACFGTARNRTFS